jgi:hypothetical protein
MNLPVNASNRIQFYVVNCYYWADSNSDTYFSLQSFPYMITPEWNLCFDIEESYAPCSEILKK